MDMTDAIADYAAATAVFVEVARRIDPADLDRHAEGEWSARQVIHHLADAEIEAASRLRRLLGEAPGTALLAFDEAGWATAPALDYAGAPVTTSLAIIEALRTSAVDILHRLMPADLERHGEHSTRGSYSVADWIAGHTEHPRVHATQMLEALASEG